MTADTTQTILPATFNDFLGNSTAIEHLRTAIAAVAFPHSLILRRTSGAGNPHAGPYARHGRRVRAPASRSLVKRPVPRQLLRSLCHNCTRIASAANLEDEVDKKAVAAREELREIDKKETRILVQPHPDVLIVPPDPPQLLIKLGQIRTVIQRAHYLPNEAPRKIFILTAANFMKEAANSLLRFSRSHPTPSTSSLSLKILANSSLPSAPAVPPYASALCPSKRSRCSSPTANPTSRRSSARLSPASPRERQARRSASISRPIPPPALMPSSSCATPQPPTAVRPSRVPGQRAGYNPTTPPSSR